MSENLPLRIGLLGLGNLMRTDDAVGMLALRSLMDDSRLPVEVHAIEGGSLGLDLLDSLCGISHLLALDAVDTGVAPGTLVRFERDELDRLPVSKSVHLLGFSDLLGVLHLMEAAPVEVVLLGVQPQSTDWGTVLTPALEAARKDLVEAALRQIESWATRTIAAQVAHPFQIESTISQLCDARHCQTGVSRSIFTRSAKNAQGTQVVDHERSAEVFKIEQKLP